MPSPRSRTILLALLALTLLGPAAVAASAGPTASTGFSPASRFDSLERGVVAEINDLRRRHGLLPLRASRSLSEAANAHSRGDGADRFLRPQLLGRHCLLEARQALLRRQELRRLVGRREPALGVAHGRPGASGADVARQPAASTQHPDAPPGARSGLPRSRWRQRRASSAVSRSRSSRPTSAFGSSDTLGVLAPVAQLDRAAAF